MPQHESQGLYQGHHAPQLCVFWACELRPQRPEENLRHALLQHRTSTDRRVLDRCLTATRGVRETTATSLLPEREVADSCTQGSTPRDVVSLKDACSVPSGTLHRSGHTLPPLRISNTTQTESSWVKKDFGQHSQPLLETWSGKIGRRVQKCMLARLFSTRRACRLVGSGLLSMF